MSDSTQDTHEEAHTGPIRTPKQLLVTVLLSFIVPVFVIVGLVAYVVSDSKPAGSNEVDKFVLGGVSAQDLERNTALRIQKVGTVEIRDANRPLKSGQEVYNAQCAACHAQGVAGAPKFGDAASWANRLRSGFEQMVQSALKGKGAMPAQAGGDHEDTEIARAVAYLANSAGAKFAEPAAPALPAGQPAQAQAGVTAAVPVAAPAATTVAAAATPPAPAAPVAVAAAAGGSKGEALYKQACAVCHAAGVANAPKLGDKAAWAPRLKEGVPHLYETAIKGKGAMPPKGGSTAPDADVRAAVDYMVSTVR